MANALLTKAYEREVEPALQRVLLSLCDQANDHGVCWPSVGHIAWRLGLSERTVRRAIDALVKVGAVRKQRRYGTSSVYTIHLDALPAKIPFEEWQLRSRRAQSGQNVRIQSGHSDRISPVKMSGKSGRSRVRTDAVVAVSDQPSLEPSMNPNGTDVPALPSKPSSVPEPANGPPSPTVPSRAKDLPHGRAPGDVQAMINAYARAKGMQPSAVSGKNRGQAFNVFKHAPAWAGPAEVDACTRYFLADPFYAAPGKLTVQKVADTLDEWNAAGRPVSIAAARALAPRSGDSRSVRAATYARELKEAGL